MGVLTQRVHDKLNGQLWRCLREVVVRVSEVLLGVSLEVEGEWTGNYVKFASSPAAPTYAAVWPKRSPIRLIIGLALPEDFEAEGLGPAPEPILYRGITKFLVINEGQAIPEELAGWAKRAYEQTLSSEKLSPSCTSAASNPT